MLKLYDLMVLTESCLQGQKPDLARLLHTWARYDPRGDLKMLLTNSGLTPAAMARVVVALAADAEDENRRMLESCMRCAERGEVYACQLLLEIADRPDSLIHRRLSEAGFDFNVLRLTIEKCRGDEKGFLAGIGMAIDENANGIVKYGRDLTACAEKGELTGLQGRNEEVARLTDILLRYRKGNVAITGPAGVGKTTLVELLALKIVSGRVPQQLRNAKILEIYMGAVVAGTRYRGDFEERMNQIIQAAIKHENLILFIDEMHLIWGAGRANNIITDAANLLKPFLARGDLRIIGATTSEEYQRYIARDAALARRFQEIRLEEPDTVLATAMVEAQARDLSAHHGVTIDRDTVAYAVALTDRYLINRSQPDKSVDLLDSACVQKAGAGLNSLEPKDLDRVLSDQMGLDTGDPGHAEQEKMRRLSARLKKEIIGQDEAVDAVIGTYVEHSLDKQSEDRNLGCFLAMGSTGIGKTELVRQFAAAVFDSRHALLHLDGAEYSRADAVTKLIGSPPGTYDSEKEGVLTDWIHTHGKGVILLDEVEKAHPEVIRLFLRPLDNGRLMSARGKPLDLRQCVIFMTSNALTGEDLKKSTIGFDRDSSRTDIAGRLKDCFPPEFLGRFDEILLFNTLGDEDMKKIILKNVTAELECLRQNRITVVFDRDRLAAFLLSLLRQNHAGARGIKKLIKKRLMQPIALARLNFENKTPLQVTLAEAFYQNGEVLAEVCQDKTNSKEKEMAL